MLGEFYYEQIVYEMTAYIDMLGIPPMRKEWKIEKKCDFYGRPCQKKRGARGGGGIYFVVKSPFFPWGLHLDKIVPVFEHGSSTLGDHGSMWSSLIKNRKEEMEWREGRERRGKRRGGGGEEKWGILSGNGCF